MNGDGFARRYCRDALLLLPLLRLMSGQDAQCWAQDGSIFRMVMELDGKQTLKQRAGGKMSAKGEKCKT